jgi:exopolysaccharide biosynthesis polyprenyl glycosylphosphotransferase
VSLLDRTVDGAPVLAPSSPGVEGAVEANGVSVAAAPDPALPTTGSRRRWSAKSCVVAADLVTICTALALAYRLRSVIPGMSETTGYAPRLHVLLALLSLPIWISLFFHHGLYLGRKVSSRVEEFRGIAHAVAGSVLGMVVLAFVFKLNVSRGWLVVMLLLTTALVTAEREIVRRVFAALRRRGHMLRPVIIVGTNDEAVELCSLLTGEPTLGYRVVGLVGDADSPFTPKAREWTLLGPVDQTAEAVHRTGATGVILATSAIGLAAANRLVRELGTAGVHVEMSSPLADISATRLTVQPLGRSPVVYVEPIRLVGWRAAVKRAFDIAVASAGLLVTSPVLVVAAVAIRVRTGSPILFRQVRVGQAGQPFRMIKLRTMVTNAEELLPEIEARNEAAFPLFKITDDPRVTSVGRLLRKFSIDELPQFWNVLCGSMSVVGPRPALPGEVDAWSPDVHKRLQLKPGMTGMWQVRGRCDNDFAEYTRWDLYYLDNWSLWTDLAIVAKTLPAVLSRRGAY